MKVTLSDHEATLLLPLLARAIESQKANRFLYDPVAVQVIGQSEVLMKPYPQSPPLTEEELTAFLNQALVASLGSLNADGSIHLVPVWFNYEDGDIFIGTEERTRKANNVKGNKNVSLLIDSQERPYKGVLIHGQAQLDHDDALGKRISILARHLPAEIAQKVGNDLARQFALVTIRIKPQRIISYDDAKRELFDRTPGARVT